MPHIALVVVYSGRNAFSPTQLHVTRAADCNIRHVACMFVNYEIYKPLVLLFISIHECIKLIRLFEFFVFDNNKQQSLYLILFECNILAYILFDILFMV